MPSGFTMLLNMFTVFVVFVLLVVLWVVVRLLLGMRSKAVKKHVSTYAVAKRFLNDAAGILRREKTYEDVMSDGFWDEAGKNPFDDYFNKR